MESKNNGEIREWLVALSASLTLAVPSWYFGAMGWTGQRMILIGGIATLVLALIPLPGPLRRPRGSFRRLLTFAPLVPGGLLLVYLAVQVFNPSFEYVETPRGIWPWRMDPLPKETYAEWLPTGFRAPFHWMNGWRQWLVLSGVFCLSLGVWCGVRRRQVIWLILGIVALNGLGLAVIGALQAATGTEKILWSQTFNGRSNWATFIYRNHAGAYLYLAAMAAVVLGFAFSRRARRMGLKSHPGPIFWMIATLILASAAASGSRGGALFSVMLLLVWIPLMLWDTARNGMVAIVLGLLLAGVGAGAVWWKWEDVAAFFARTTERLNETLEENQPDEPEEDFDQLLARRLDARWLSAKVTMKMANERPWYGWGGGGFRYFFPYYQSMEPGLRGFGSEVPPRFRHLFPHESRDRFSLYVYAHSDPLQYLTEWGRIGFGLAVVALLSVIVQIIVWSRHCRAEHWAAFVALAVVVVHSCVDFILSNPAVFSVFCVLLLLQARGLGIRQEAGRGSD